MPPVERIYPIGRLSHPITLLIVARSVSAPSAPTAKSNFDTATLQVEKTKMDDYRIP